MLVRPILGALPWSSALQAAQPIIGAAADGYCPKLPDGSAFRWSYDEQSGFCLAHRGDPLTDITGTIGVSIANNEDFFTERPQAYPQKQSCGTEVNGYRMRAKGVSPGLQTLFDGPDGGPVRVWILADDSSTISKLLSIASKIDFDKATP
jgi:hypothetical protein